jgi:ribosomal protein L20
MKSKPPTIPRADAPAPTTELSDAQAQALIDNGKATDAAMAAAQAPAAPTVPKGYWEAADGSLVPESKVKDLDKARDQVVRRLVAAAREMSVQLEAFRRLTLTEIETFVEMSAATYGVVVRGAAGKGNVTLTTFDGRLKVERAISERIAFDERLQVAKAAIDDCIHRWGKGANDNLKLIVNQAFSVDKAGRVSVAKVLDLRNAKIDDPQWLQAMEAVADATMRVGSATYVRFYFRDDTTGKYVPINLSMSAS